MCCVAHMPQHNIACYACAVRHTCHSITSLAMHVLCGAHATYARDRFMWTQHKAIIVVRLYIPFSLFPPPLGNTAIIVVRLITAFLLLFPAGTAAPRLLYTSFLLAMVFTGGAVRVWGTTVPWPQHYGNLHDVLQPSHRRPRFQSPSTGKQSAQNSVVTGGHGPH